MTLSVHGRMRAADIKTLLSVLRGTVQRGFYALFADVVFLVLAGVMLAPVIHHVSSALPPRSGRRAGPESLTHPSLPMSSSKLQGSYGRGRQAKRRFTHNAG